MEKLEIKELKFLLVLLSYPEYRTRLTKIDQKRINPGTSAAGRDKICSELVDKGMLECNSEVAKFEIKSAGRELLKAEEYDLPKYELRALQSASKENTPITPGKTGIPLDKRQEVLKSLAERGYIKLEEKIADIWLSEQGKIFLRDQYDPVHSSPIGLQLVKYYIEFLRQELSQKTDPGTGKPDDDDILEMIRELDQAYNTENYVPIFRLREKVQPPLSKEELNEALFRLVREDKIELSALQDNISSYTNEQLATGIPQDIGGSLFFVILI